MEDGDAHKALDLEIDKTFATIAEVNRGGSAALGGYVATLLTTLALTFGRGLGIADRVTVPLLQLAVDRQAAAVATLLLSAGLLYRWMLANTMEGILDRDLRFALRRRYGRASGRRILYRHASLIRMTTVVFERWPRADRLITLGLLLFVLAATLLFPPLLAWLLVWQGGFPALAQLALILLSILAALPTILVLVAGTKHDRAEEAEEEPQEPLWARVLYGAALLGSAGWLWLLLQEWGIRYPVPVLLVSTLWAALFGGALAVRVRGQIADAPGDV